MIDKFSKNYITKLEQSINHKFKNIDLIHEALSHPSLKQYESEQWQKDYERFEILGDAILGFIITEILFHTYKKSDEGKIAKIKSHLVSKETICNVAKKINLANFIIMTKGEEDTGGRSNPNNVENTMEALIAAIYLDSNIETTKKIIIKLWSEFLHNFDLNQIDPKTSLQEWSQGNQHGMPHYEIVSKKGSDHMPRFTVCVYAGPHKETGHGNSIKNAEKEAAKKLLLHLDINVDLV
ncbi:MAG: ribonuclease III [Rickettsiaceae bacterium]